MFLSSIVFEVFSFVWYNLMKQIPKKMWKKMRQRQKNACVYTYSTLFIAEPLQTFCCDPGNKNSFLFQTTIVYCLSDDWTSFNEVKLALVIETSKWNLGGQRMFCFIPKQRVLWVVWTRCVWNYKMLYSMLSLCLTQKETVTKSERERRGSVRFTRYLIWKEYGSAMQLADI